MCSRTYRDSWLEGWRGQPVRTNWWMEWRQFLSWWGRWSGEDWKRVTSDEENWGWLWLFLAQVDAYYETHSTDDGTLKTVCWLECLRTWRDKNHHHHQSIIDINALLYTASSWLGSFTKQCMVTVSFDQNLQSQTNFMVSTAISLKSYTCVRILSLRKYFAIAFLPTTAGYKAFLQLQNSIQYYWMLPTE